MSAPPPMDDRLPPLLPGPEQPVTSTPPRAPGSVRRTITWDMSRPDGLLGPTVVDLRGQDVVTDPSGEGRVIDRLEARLVVDLMLWSITEAQSSTTERSLDDLVGLSTRGGYGRALTERFADEQATRSLLFAGLEDLGGAMLVSGYTLLRGGVLEGTPEQGAERAAAQADVCAGWIDGGAMIESMRHTGVAPLPVGPPAPDIATTDPLGWHTMAELETLSVRRRRRLDVRTGPDGVGLALQHHFRDSFAAPEGERAMHEYLLDADVAADGSIERVNVDARVLPWSECPGAVASAQRVVGVPLDDIAGMIRPHLMGPTTCTHLTSTLRMLADAAALGSVLPTS